MDALHSARANSSSMLTSSPVIDAASNTSRRSPSSSVVGLRNLAVALQCFSVASWLKWYVHTRKFGVRRRWTWTSSFNHFLFNLFVFVGCTYGDRVREIALFVVLLRGANHGYWVGRRLNPVDFEFETFQKCQAARVRRVNLRTDRLNES